MMHRASDDLSDPDRNLAESTGQSDIPEDLELDLINEDSDVRIHTPPPRLAARFYRPTNNRRKTSAASSRRNSISSAHSQQSHTSSRHSSQSNHVAQHLRRTSIIEDRKARLADRAAHAEKVRLRAALAKAAPRSTTNSEERALAAQQAREKNLAEIVASCAEEVKRAKGIAESIKEKREADLKKLKRDMEERLADAERRREEILNRGNTTKRGRSQSQPRKSFPLPVIAEPISEATAASRIQHQWRIYRRRTALKEFAEFGISIDNIRETSFDTVGELLAQEKVLLATARILRTCGLREGEIGSVSEMTAVRTFLAAFVILGHPTQVLSSKSDCGDQEQVGVLPMRRDDLANPQLQDLVAKARDLLISFENVLSRLNTANNYTPPPAQLSVLLETYGIFYHAFIAWKARDSTTLIDMMVLQFVELDSIWQTVKDSTELAVTDSYREGIRENQIQLMVRIKRLAGPAEGKRLISKAIRDSRKALAAKKPVGDSKPRTAESESSHDPSISVKTVGSHLQTLTPPPTPPRHQSSETHDAEGLRHAVSVLPDNRVLAHELAMDKDYRIKVDDFIGERAVVTQAIFDTMRREVAAGNIEPWILAMAENVKTRLLHLLTKRHPFHSIVTEGLDTEVVAQELRNGSFSYEKFFSFMGKILPNLCAPFRDAQLSDLINNTLNSGDFVTRLQALMDFIDLMRLDYANHLLGESASELIKHAAPYESRQFAKTMEETSNSLSATENAWRIARGKVMTEASKRDPENVQLARARPTPNKIYAQMLVDVFTSVDSSIVIPETLQLDAKRANRIRSDILRTVTTGAILLQSKNLLKRDVRSQWKIEATRVYSVLESAKSTDQAVQGIQAALESSRSMPPATKKHIKDLVTRIVGASAAVASSDEATEIRDPVMRLLLMRLRTHFMGRLGASSEREKIRMASTASENLASLGLPEFVQRVGGMVDEVNRVGALDREGHGAWYEMIANTIEQEATGSIS